MEVQCFQASRDMRSRGRMLTSFLAGFSITTRLSLRPTTVPTEKARKTSCSRRLSPFLDFLYFLSLLSYFLQFYFLYFLKFYVLYSLGGPGNPPLFFNASQCVLLVFTVFQCFSLLSYCFATFHYFSLRFTTLFAGKLQKTSEKHTTKTVENIERH